MSTPRLASLLLLLTAVLAGCDSKTDTPTAATDNVGRARKLLAEAGFPDGKGFPKIEVLYNTDEGHKRIAAYLQQEWRKKLGIDVELRNSEWKVYLDDMSKMRYQIVRRGWIGDYRDPMTFIELFTSHSGNNNTGWSSAAYDKLVKDAGAEADPKKRYELLRQAEKLLIDEVPA